jgi:hypothetical protein
MEIWEPKPPGTLRATPGLLRDSFTFTFYIGLDGVSKFHFSISEKSITGNVPPGIRTVRGESGILTTMKTHFEK